MILIDTNSLIVLVLGMINPNIVNSHPRTSIYSCQDYIELISVIEDLSNLIVLPNIWTEVDNLLSNNNKNIKDKCVQNIKLLTEKTTEKYLETRLAYNTPYIYEVGLTDSLIIEIAKECQLLITSDSRLSDIAIANGVEVYDMIKIKHLRAGIN